MVLHHQDKCQVVKKELNKERYSANFQIHKGNGQLWLNNGLCTQRHQKTAYYFLYLTVSDVGIRITTTYFVDGQPLESKPGLHIYQLTRISGADTISKARMPCQTTLLLQSHLCFQFSNISFYSRQDFRTAQHYFLVLQSDIQIAQQTHYNFKNLKQSEEQRVHLLYFLTLLFLNLTLPSPQHRLFPLSDQVSHRIQLEEGYTIKFSPPDNKYVRKKRIDHQLKKNSSKERINSRLGKSFFC